MTRMNQRELVNSLDEYICSVVLNTAEQKEAFIYTLLQNNEFLHTRLSKSLSKLSIEVYWDTIQSCDHNSRALINNLDILLCTISLIALHIQDISLQYEPLMEFLERFDIGYLEERDIDE